MITLILPAPIYGGLFFIKFIALDFVLKKGYNFVMSVSNEKILIVDFMYLWNRVYAIKEAGTGMHIFNCLNNVNESDYYFRKFIVLDGKNSTKYRRNIYSEYKANRSDKTSTYAAMEKFLLYNAPKLHTLRFMKNDDYEADDIITAIVQYYTEAEKYIYSGDTDLYQLLRYPKTYIGSKYSKGMIIEPIAKGTAETCYNKRYKLKVNDASYIVKCKTFKGDTSDNIPIACPGMRTATIDTLIEKFWSNDEPLTSKILLNMATYLRDNCKQSEFDNFYHNRYALIRNYRLTQLGYTDTNVWEDMKYLKGSGLWE